MTTKQAPTSPIICPEELLDSHGTIWRLFDARSGAPGRAAYRKRHLAGALHADLDHDLAAPAPEPARGGRHPLPEIEQWARTLGNWGLTPETAIAIYDDQGGANAAARLWWLLRASGHEKSTVVDGGYQAAVRAGLPTSGEAVQPEAAPPYPVASWSWPTADLTEVERRRRDPAWKVVDVRSTERYRGETEPFDPVKGHIPGAVNLPYASLLDSEGRFLRGPELERRLDEALGSSSDSVIVHCGSGVTACHTLLAMELAGLERAPLYVGSWSEWCRACPDEIARDDRSAQTGQPGVRDE